MSNSIRLPKNNKKIFMMLVLLSLLVISTSSQAAYWVPRPIVASGGQIYQYYLWGERALINGQYRYHKGIDFPYGTGTAVYAVANGTVVDLAEGYSNGERESTWGNYVVIRHDKRHFDRSSGQWAYVYSMYIHLSESSVQPQLGNWVRAGAWIANSDDTGSGSSGPHFHLQIVVHPQSDRTISTLDSANRSRNPELWLTPHNYNNNNTGRVVGRVSDANGNPVPDVTVWGLQKQAGWGYGFNKTYTTATTLPGDDLLTENWGTTDVTPGSWPITTSDGRNYGWVNVIAGQTTYVGLYPVWLSEVKGNYSGWNSEIIIRNESSTSWASITVTYFYTDGNVRSQAAASIGPSGALTLSPPSSFSGSALLVSSEKVSVVVKSQDGDTSLSYNGVMATDPTNLGWSQIGNKLYAPVIMENYYGWTSAIVLVNTGADTASVTINYYGPGGVNPVYSPSFTLAPNQSTTMNYGSTNTLYTAVISSSVHRQPQRLPDLQHLFCRFL